MTKTVLEIHHLNKPIGINHTRVIRNALAAEFVEVDRKAFEQFVAGVNYRRDLFGGIRKYWLVSTGKIAAFYTNEPPFRFFIEPTGMGVDYL